MELQKLVESYRPKAEVLEAMGTLSVLATVGTSASGKNSIMETATKFDPSLKLVLDETSRLSRVHERQGQHFLFRTRGEILEDLQNGDLVQIAVGPNGDLYCTRISSYPHVGVGLIPLVPAAVEEFRQLPFASFDAAYIVPANYEKWQQWLEQQARSSQWTAEQKQGRLGEAQKSYEFALQDEQMRFV